MACKSMHGVAKAHTARKSKLAVQQHARRARARAACKRTHGVR